MPVEHFEAQPAAPQPRGALVFLPGFSDGPDDFIEHGFVELAKQHAPGFDVFATNAHFRYYAKWNLLQRLHDDVIGPLRDQGYERVWLVGISMGGLGCLAYAEAYPDQVDGLILLAGYMGPKDLIEEVEEAGGLAKWQPGDTSQIEDDEDRLYREIWAFLKREAGPVGGGEVDLYLGFGDKDRLSRPAGLVAAQLPPEQVLTIEGGHKWVTWRPLFAELLPRALAQR